MVEIHQNDYFVLCKGVPYKLYRVYCALQVICDPLSNCSWTPAKANAMIAAAWVISLFLCVPQVILDLEIQGLDAG